jgi:ABC-type Zn2+ transport system substrate-binding protein/surface adhesin
MGLFKTYRYLFLAICLMMASIVFANDTVIVVKDARMDMLTSKQAQVNKRTSMMTSGGQYKGFRIQVSSSNSRDNATAIKTDLMNKFPEHKTYIIFQSPNFKVRIGNFIKREEAEKLRKQLNKYFPQGVYVVEDAIEYYPKDELNF